MAKMTIERKPTTEELRNYIPTGFQTIEKRFRVNRVKVEQEHVKKHKPYCARCADLDFTDMWENKKKELERQVGVGEQGDQTSITFDFPDLEKYGNEDRFDLTGKQPIIREVINDGVRVPKKVGEYFEYRCKVRKCGHSIEVPFIDYMNEPVKEKTEKTTE